MYAQCTRYKNIPTYNMCVSNECVRTHGERSVQWSGIQKCFTTISYKIAAMRVTKELRRAVKIVRARAIITRLWRSLCPEGAVDDRMRRGHVWDPKNVDFTSIARRSVNFHVTFVIYSKGFDLGDGTGEIWFSLFSYTM